MIWQQIQTAKKEGRDRHVVFLNLANAFGWVPHCLLWTAFDYFRVPEVFKALERSYFQDIQLCLLTDEYTRAGRRYHGWMYHFTARLYYGYGSHPLSLSVVCRR